MAGSDRWLEYAGNPVLEPGNRDEFDGLDYTHTDLHKFTHVF